MDYSRRELADALAADYACGTLRGAARRRFEALLPAHPALREATTRWLERLMPLSASLMPVEPSGDVWRRVSERIGAGNGTRIAATQSAWERLAFWRGLTAFASVAAIGLALLLVNPRAMPPPIVVVLAATGDAAASPAAGTIVASISGDRATLVARPILPVSVKADKSLELWAVPKEGAARSLGVLPEGSGTVALRGKVLANTDTLAVTLEAAGGSPDGKAKGPILYAGKFAL